MTNNESTKAPVKALSCQNPACTNAEFKIYQLRSAMIISCTNCLRELGMIENAPEYEPNTDANIKINWAGKDGLY